MTEIESIIDEMKLIHSGTAWQLSLREALEKIT